MSHNDVWSDIFSLKIKSQGIRFVCTYNFSSVLPNITQSLNRPWYHYCTHLFTSVLIAVLMRFKSICINNYLWYFTKTMGSKVEGCHKYALFCYL